MTVQELIDQLKQYNPELPVIIRGEVVGSDDLTHNGFEIIDDEFYDWDTDSTIKALILDSGSW